MIEYGLTRFPEEKGEIIMAPVGPGSNSRSVTQLEVRISNLRTVARGSTGRPGTNQLTKWRV